MTAYTHFTNIECAWLFSKINHIGPIPKQIFWTTRGLLSQIAAVPNTGSSPFLVGGPWGSVVSHVLSLRATGSAHCLKCLSIPEFWKMERTTEPEMRSCRNFGTWPTGTRSLIRFFNIKILLDTTLTLLATTGAIVGDTWNQYRQGKKPSSLLFILGARDTNWKSQGAKIGTYLGFNLFTN